MKEAGRSAAFPFYAEEWLADEHVQSMTLEEEGAYIRALSCCWRAGSIPSDLALLSSCARPLPRAYWAWLLRGSRDTPFSQTA